MTRAWIVVGLAALLVLPGCLDSETYSGLWEDLEAKEKFQERSLYTETVEFGPQNAVDPNNPPTSPPGGLEDVGDAWNTTIPVPDGTRRLTVLFTVNFSTSDTSSGPLPANPPDGDMFIYARGPNAQNESQNTTIEENAHLGFDFTDPSGGEWTLGYEARGQGTISWRVIGEVPVNRTDG